MSSRSGGRGSTTAILLLVGVVAVLLGWTAMNLRGGVADAEDLDDRAQATGTVGECTRQGPVSLAGVGYWWSCEVEVTKNNGESVTQVFNGSQFGPDETGTTVPLAGAGRDSSTWRRADLPGHNWAVMATAVGLIGGGICLITGVRRLMRR